MTNTNCDWRRQAACRNTNPETFFPVGEGGPAYERQVAEAKSVCAGCPLRQACIDEALVRIPEGIAGGLTAAERRRLSRRAVRPVTGGELIRDGRTRAEVAAAGSMLLAAGGSRLAVAEACGVSERTVYRWQAQAASAGRAS